MRYFLSLLLLGFSLLAFDLQKPKIYTPEQNITGWLISEKLDGIRAYWDGRSLFTRQNNKINAPEWFLSDFPPFELDGELWIDRGKFEQVQNIVMDKIPSEEWQKITYNIFEVPNSEGNFTARLNKANDWFTKNPNHHVKIIEQIECKNKKQLHLFLDKVIKLGGEGVVLKNPKPDYFGGRSNQILKVKKFDDMEGEVISINISVKTDLLGSLTLKLPNGITFKLGSGFDENFRKNPPKLGDMVTFKYLGFSKNGKPKFASFLRVRKD